MQADKRTLISKFELGIPIRDMRLLDSTLVTTSRGYIAVRENAIVFAVECAPYGVGGRVRTEANPRLRQGSKLMALGSRHDMRPRLGVTTAPASQLSSCKLWLRMLRAKLGGCRTLADSLL